MRTAPPPRGTVSWCSREIANRGDLPTIRNDEELPVTRERTVYLLDLLARLRARRRPEELPLVSGGYWAETKSMQGDILDYLTQPASQTAAQAG